MTNHLPLRTRMRALSVATALACNLLAGVALAAEPIPLASVPAPLPPIAWSPAQALAAGVGTQTLGAASVNTGAGLVLQGTVELPPQATELLSAPLAGIVQQVLVGTGQSVRAGAPVARLLSTDLITWQRELLQAQAQEKLAATKLQRDEQLHAEGIIAGLRLQDSRTQHQLAELTVRERRQMLQLAGVRDANPSLSSGLTVHAATAGTVLEVLATPGQRLEAGMPIAKMARAGHLSITLQASVEQVRTLQVGDLLMLPDCKAPAKLVAIVPQVSEGNQLVQLRADYTGNDACLRVHQFVQATVVGRPASGKANSADTTGLNVPPQAVVRHAGKAYVFLRTAHGFVPTAVELSGEGSGALQVRSGLKMGDTIAVRGIAALKGAWLGLGGGEQ